MRFTPPGTIKHVQLPATKGDRLQQKPSRLSPSGINQLNGEGRSLAPSSGFAQPVRTSCSAKNRQTKPTIDRDTNGDESEPRVRPKKRQADQRQSSVPAWHQQRSDPHKHATRQVTNDTCKVRCDDLETSGGHPTKHGSREEGDAQKNFRPQTKRHATS